jgi:hypothetical protein
MMLLVFFDSLSSYMQWAPRKRQVNDIHSAALGARFVSLADSESHKLLPRKSYKENQFILTFFF